MAARPASTAVEAISPARRALATRMTAPAIAKTTVTSSGQPRRDDVATMTSKLAPTTPTAMSGALMRMRPCWKPSSAKAGCDASGRHGTSSVITVRSADRDVDQDPSMAARPSPSVADQPMPGVAWGSMPLPLSETVMRQRPWRRVAATRTSVALPWRTALRAHSTMAARAARRVSSLTGRSSAEGSMRTMSAAMRAAVASRTSSARSTLEGRLVWSSPGETSCASPRRSRVSVWRM